MTALVLAAAVALTVVVTCGVLVAVHEVSHRERGEGG